MISFPTCKINIGLRIVEKRPDGYHNLQTIFYPIALHDVLEIIEAPAGSEAVTYSHSGLPIFSNSQNNLCIRAYHLLRNDFKNLPPIKMHLHKCIPMGAGLGGGSADAAFALQSINTQFYLGLSEQALMNYALELGSDCPFFILNKPCLAHGRGERLQPLPLQLNNYKIVLVNPGIHINTGMAFSEIKPGNLHSTPLDSLIPLPIEQWKQHIHNDFETPVFARHPQIAEIKNLLYQHGAHYASMSGSGSTVYGIFDAEVAIPLPQSYFVKWV